MSTISDWSTNPNDNDPQNSDPIAYPADGVSDLGYVLRDLKAVERQESLNKGWWPDVRTASRISNNVFTCSSVDGSDYPIGTAVKLIGSSSEVYGWIIGISGSDFTIKPSGQITTGFGLTGVIFSAILPSSNADNFGDGYPKDIGSALPARMTQWGRAQISEDNTTATVLLAKTEPDTDYRVLTQAVEVANGPAANGAYRRTVTSKGTGSFVLTVDTAPGAAASGIVVYFEYAIFRGE